MPEQVQPGRGDVDMIPEGQGTHQPHTDAETTESRPITDEFDIAYGCLPKREDIEDVAAYLSGLQLA